MSSLELFCPSDDQRSQILECTFGDLARLAGFPKTGDPGRCAQPNVVA
jgi:hypothetical protein